MSHDKRLSKDRLLSWSLSLFVCGITLLVAAPAKAQRFGGGAVGGVYVDVEGTLVNVDSSEMKTVREERAKALAVIDTDLAKASKRRKVSLRKLAEAIADARKQQPQGALADEFRFLAGLQRIEYLFVMPEQHDIVIAGPAEGWKINERGDVVGAKTGLPTLRLEDLVVALKSADQARAQGISCSIDPTPEGIQRLNAYLKKQKTFGAQVKAGVESSLGPQNITLVGLPTDSRMAHVLLAADYRMKRFAMQLEPAPIKDMPSYLELLKKARTKPAAEMTPRWWMAADYKPLLTDGEGLAWQIRSGVKVMSEDERREADGKVKGTGKTNALAKKWADTMTTKYAELSAKESIFADLRNCMDIAVFAALVSKFELEKKAGYELKSYKNGVVPSGEALAAPNHVATEVSLVQSGREWIITASGGVQFSSWDLAGKKESDPKLSDALKAVGASQRWWWD